jgi:hypothetical protein
MVSDYFNYLLCGKDVSELFSKESTSLFKEYIKESFNYIWNHIILVKRFSL